MARLSMFVRLAFRSLYAHKIKNLIVGGIMLFGTFLVVMGTAILDSVESAMSRSIISSLAGHLQVYSEKSRDELALFGGNFMGAEDLGRIPKFGEVRATLSAVPNVEAIVPMGIGMAATNTGNEMDRIIDSLRAAVGRGDEARARIIEKQITEVAHTLAGDRARHLLLSAEPEKVKAEIADLERVQTEAFWSEFRADPEAGFTFLDTKIAPVAPDDPLLYIRYVGTDLDAFARHFDRFKIISGEMVPRGQRGFLLNQKWLDDWIKNKVARELDGIKKELDDGKTIAGDAKVAARVRRLPAQYGRVVFQLEPPEAQALDAELKALLPAVEGDLRDRMKAFLVVNDENFRARYDWFYAHVAPKIALYLAKVGDTLTVRSYTQSGYLKSMNVKVWGTFQFQGLETSEVSGGMSLVDLVTFRDLYGEPTAAMREEAAKIKEAVGVETVDREDAEAALFGEAANTIATTEDTSFDEFAGVDLAERAEERKAGQERPYDPKLLEDGMALNAAIILADPERLRETQAEIAKIAADAGLGLKVVDWQKAAGMVGQFIVFVRVVLYLIIGIMFIIALVIINNSMIMATMERITEIGTMRAIGAQRSFILTTFLLETIVLGILAGTFGAALGAGLVAYLGQTGIPAPHDVLVFLFSGPRLFPSFTIAHLVTGVVVILIVSLISTMYPAFIATRIEPVVAMEARE